jgi:hypothetical protein
MHRFSFALAAIFAAGTLSAYAEEDQSYAPVVQQTANPMDQSGQGDPQSSGTGAVEQGGNAPGRGDPTGTAAPGGVVTSPTPTGPGRSDNQ